MTQINKDHLWGRGDLWMQIHDVESKCHWNHGQTHCLCHHTTTLSWCSQMKKTERNLGELTFHVNMKMGDVWTKLSSQYLYVSLSGMSQSMIVWPHGVLHSYNGCCQPTTRPDELCESGVQINYFFWIARIVSLVCKRVVSSRIVDEYGIYIPSITKSHQSPSWLCGQH